MKDSVLLCISTLLETANHYSLFAGIQPLRLSHPAHHSLTNRVSTPSLRAGRMFSMKTAAGIPLFETMQISLICRKFCFLCAPFRPHLFLFML